MLSQQRAETSSYAQCFTSVASLHTETINIWSHLLGAIWFYSSTVQFGSACTNPFTQDAAAVLMYLLTVSICFSCSTFYHVVASHIQHERWQRVDHIGILCLIWTSSTSFVFFAFQRQQRVRRVYILLLSLLAVLGLVRLSYVGMNVSHARQSRITTHGVFGSVAILPSLHYKYTNRTIDPRFGILRAFWTLVVVNAVGGGIYATKIHDNVVGGGIGVPDISHHVMHGTAVWAAWSYQQGLLSTYNLHLKGRERTGVGAKKTDMNA
jgi:adiponectin receptor